MMNKQRKRRPKRARQRLPAAAATATPVTADHDHHRPRRCNRARSRLRDDRRSRDQQAPLRLSRRDLSFLLGRLPHQIRRRSRDLSRTRTAGRRPPCRKARSTPARCIRRSARSAPEAARSAAWRWSRRLRAVDAPPNPELADMTRRFWIGLVLALPVGRAGNGRPSRRRPRLGRSDAVELDSARVRHAGGAVGRLAVLRARLAIAA